MPATGHPKRTGQEVNLLIFRSPDGRAHFVAQQVDRPDPAETQEGSWWTRLRSRVADGYRRLRQHFAYQERILGQLRHAEQLSVYHAVSFEPDQVEKDLLKQLRASHGKHTRWFIVDAIVAGLGGILTPLPGPNVFFFYPAIRALGHYLARKGARHAGRLPRSIHGEPLIDTVEEWGPTDLERVAGELRLLEERYSTDPLMELLESEVYER